MTAAAVQSDGPPRYSFTNKWFDNNAMAWDRTIDFVKPTQFLEVGCYEGRATTYFIERCSVYGALDITCIDTWEGAVDLPPDVMKGVEKRFDDNVALAMNWSGSRVLFRKMKKRSALALPNLIIEGKQFDFIYIDGSHTAPDVLTDAIDAFRLLREGGVMIFDDYLWTMEKHGQEDSLNMPKPAIDAFVNLFQRRIQLLDSIGAQLSVMKTS